MERRGGGLRRAVLEGRPEAEVGEDLFDDRGLVNDLQLRTPYPFPALS